MADASWIEELGRQQAADALVAVRARQMATGCERLVLAMHWADLHDEETTRREQGTGDRGTASGPRMRGVERVVFLGGAGTPGVGEFAVPELAVYLGISRRAASDLLADVLDLRHRLPQLWTRVDVGGVWDWKAREVARRTRACGLSVEQARWVDGQVAGYVGSLPWSRFVKLLEAKLIEADPAAAEARRKAAALERFVRTGRCNEYGLSTIVAKAEAGDAVFFVAMCDRIAGCLAADGDTDPVDVRRSKAIGMLANPAAALTLLARHAALDTTTSDGDDSAGAQGRGVADDSGDGTADDEPAMGECPDCGAGSAGTGMAGDPEAFVKALATIDPRKLLPTATLYIHLSRESFDAGRTRSGLRADPLPGVARVEGIGPITPGQVREFLQHAQVTVRPVLDLEDDSPVDGYEVPDRMREQLHLRSPACVFPYSPDLSRTKDADHTVPYVPPDQGGPPGQTRIGNLGPLGRGAHRLKTHARGWAHRQPAAGVHLWRTRQGYWFRVDASGTYPLGKHATVEDLAGRPRRTLRLTRHPDLERWHRAPARDDPRSQGEQHLAALLAAR